MTLIELAQALNVPPRQVRYLISEGILPGAHATGRKQGAYDDTHLELGREFARLSEGGRGVRAIKSEMNEKRRFVFENDRVTVHLKDTQSLDGVTNAEIKILAAAIAKAIRAKRDKT